MCASSSPRPFSAPIWWLRLKWSIGESLTCQV
jgi:hypothetical protein